MAFDIIVPCPAFIEEICFAVRGERCWSKINIALFLILPKESERVIADQTGALVIQLQKQMVQSRLMTPGKNKDGFGSAPSDARELVAVDTTSSALKNTRSDDT